MASSSGGPVVAVDIGGTSMKGGLVNAGGRIVARGRAPTPVREGADAILDALERLCRGLSGGRRIRAVGLGVPGAVDHRRGVVASSPNVPCWKDHPIGPVLAERLGIRVVVDNDANLAALGEAWLGAGRGTRNLLMVTLGTGIGGGILVGGRVWHGEAGRAGELGHTVVALGGAPCGCGNRGCIEAYASATGIRRLWIEAARGVPRGRARRAVAPPVEVIAARARRGDRRGAEVFRRAGRALGAAFATWLNVLDVHTIVVGGGVAPALDLLLPHARAEMEPRMFGLDVSRIRIIRGTLGDDAGVLGAARLALGRGATDCGSSCSAALRVAVRLRREPSGQSS